MLGALSSISIAVEAERELAMTLRAIAQVHRKSLRDENNLNF